MHELHCIQYTTPRVEYRQMTDSYSGRCTAASNVLAVTVISSVASVQSPCVLWLGRAHICACMVYSAWRLHTSLHAYVQRHTFRLDSVRGCEFALVVHGRRRLLGVPACGC